MTGDVDEAADEHGQPGPTRGARVALGVVAGLLALGLVGGLVVLTREGATPGVIGSGADAYDLVGVTTEGDLPTSMPRAMSSG